MEAVTFHPEPAGWAGVSCFPGRQVALVLRAPGGRGLQRFGTGEGPAWHVYGEKRSRLAREEALERHHPWAAGSHGRSSVWVGMGVT